MARTMKIAWWKWLPFQGWRSVGMTESADEIPDRLPRNGAVLVGSSQRLKWIVFDCPCRRDHRIMLNTDSARRPTWAVTEGPGTRLLVYAGRLMAQGIAPQRACEVAIVQAMTDDVLLAAGVRQVVSAIFQ